MLIGVFLIPGCSPKMTKTELMNYLQDGGLTVKFNESVHAQTMKAFLKEQIAKGSDIPLDLFGARPVWVATVK